MTPAPALHDSTVRTGRYAAVVLAAGSGSRVGTVRSKTFLPLLGRSVIGWSLQVLTGLAGVERCLLVVRPSDVDIVEDLRAREGWDSRVEVIFGGSTRHESEHRAIEHLAGAINEGTIEVVIIHDGARPCVTASLAAQVAKTALNEGGAIPGVELDGCLVAASGASVPTGTLIRTQTPQAFRAQGLLDAYRAAGVDGFTGTDTSMCVERYSDLAVRIVPSDQANIKITYPQDLFVAEGLLRQRTGDQ